MRKEKELTTGAGRNSSKSGGGWLGGRGAGRESERIGWRPGGVGTYVRTFFYCGDGNAPGKTASAVPKLIFASANGRPSEWWWAVGNSGLSQLPAAHESLSIPVGAGPTDVGYRTHATVLLVALRVPGGEQFAFFPAVPGMASSRADAREVLSGLAVARLWWGKDQNDISDTQTTVLDCTGCTVQSDCSTQDRDTETSEYRCW